MLAGVHTTYELKENIMSVSVHVRSWRRSSKVRVGVSAGRLEVKACYPEERKASAGIVSSSTR